ncbi:Dirigent protein 19 [Camellia lanceoleosa]|uniref:Dirigent protein 19 n=1 Tax=Camellia lanceoleosa TaxID=1840588 RepID=A0ACC0IQB3_9ERIC|nr:Dirigent protein 19 [Camellia lanceoleosa]
MRKSSRSNGGEVEWGNSDQLDQILKRHPGGFDLFLHIREEGNRKFLLAYVSRAKVIDAMVISEANEDVSLGSWFIGLEVEHIDEKYNVSTLALLGRDPVFDQYREMSIVGGTGFFRLARGIATASTYSFNTTSNNAVLEFHVIVIHY